METLKMLNEDIIKYLDKSVLCWLASSSKENIPNVSPKEIFTYEKPDLIYIANIASPKSVKNIFENPMVAISFVDVLIQKGYQLKGTASIIENEFNSDHAAIRKLNEMAGQDFKILSIIKIKIEQVKPILAPSYIFKSDTCEKDQIANAKKRYKID